MKKKSVQLEVPQEKSFFFAISSSDSIHKLAWSINSDCHFNLTVCNGILFSESLFPALKDDVSIPFTHILLVGNKIEQGILFKELPNVDYILKIQGNISEREVKEITACFKKISSVVAVISIDVNKFKGFRIIQLS
jgi:hypothetical protein